MTEHDVVGTSRDGDELLGVPATARGFRGALEAGILVRRKVAGQWLYATARAALEAASNVAEAAAIEHLHGWLIGTAPYLRHPVAKTSADPQLTFRAAGLLLRELVHLGRLRALALFTAEFEPHFGLYAPDDGGEVATQIEAMELQLLESGRVSPGDLPAPTRHREKKAWRWLILRHGEYLGLGRVQDGVLVAWDHDAP